MSNAHTSFRKGFTLIEILLVIAAISILASIVIVAINPAKQLAQARNAQRLSNVNTILNAVWQYAIDNNGILPLTILTTEKEICYTSDTTPCGDAVNLVDLSVLTDDEEYIAEIPVDPKCITCDADGADYTILKSLNGRVTVKAPSAEQGETISVTR